MALKLGKCRLCLKLGDFYSIFTVDNALQLAEMVMECTTVKVYEGDGLPDKICSECVQKLSSAFIFKQQCERADQELRRNYVPPPGFSITPPPPPNRQSSDSAFSTHTDTSNQLSKPSSSTDIQTPNNRSRKRSRSRSVDAASVGSRSLDPPGSSKRVQELKNSHKKRPRVESPNTSYADSDYEYDNSQFSMETDSDEPLLKEEGHFKCNKCDKVFTKRRSRASHMRVHTREALGQNALVDIPRDDDFGEDAMDAEDKLSCEKCDKTFKLKIMLKRHMGTCSGKLPPPQVSPQKELLISLQPIDQVPGVGKLDCDICTAKFKTLDNLRKHMRVIHAAVPKVDTIILPKEPVAIPCMYCGQIFDDFNVHTEHFNKCPEKRPVTSYDCPMCDKSISRVQNYLSHLRAVHFELRQVQSPGRFQCRVCARRLASQDLLVAHLAGHVNDVGAPDCDDDSRASPAEELNSDTSYTGYMPHGPNKCPYCIKSFSYKKSLETHIMKIHSNSSEPVEIKIEAPDKNASTSLLTEKYAASDSESSQEEAEDLTCDICEKMFSYKRLLVQHKRTKHNMSSGHKRAKINLKDCSVRCLICDIEMKVSAVNEHNQKHITANIKPRNLYTCAQCGEKFKACSGLANHIKLIHRLKQVPKPKVPKLQGGSELADFCEVVVTKTEPLEDIQSHNGLEVPSTAAPHVNLSGLTCPICSKTLGTLISLKRHVNWHANVGNNIESKVECFVCKETFRFKRHYRLHMSSHYKDPHIDPKHLTCAICNRKSKHLRAALAHMNFHKQTRFQNKDYQCSICKRVFQYRKVYLSHMAIHYKRGESSQNTVVGDILPENADKTAFDGSHTCHLCGKVCDSENSLKCHVTWHKSKTSLFGNRHECHICQLQFTNKRRLDYHIREHYEDANGPFKCNICGKGYIDEEYFKRHLKGHNFDNQCHKKRIEKLRKDKVKCPICTRFYPDLLHLIRHIKRTHPDSKMIKTDPDAPAPMYYSCKLCAKVFLDQRRLQNHEERHLRKPEFFKCKFCGKKTISLKSHRIHIKGHLTTKFLDNPLKCTQCDEMFIKGYDLHHHLRDVHNIEETWIAERNEQALTGPLKDLQCSVCLKILASKGNYERHLDYHNSLRCNYCFDYFSSLRFLEGHLAFSCDKKKLIGDTEPHPRKIKCHVCYKAFHLQVKLDCHLRTQHNILVNKEASSDRKDIVCDYCFKVFENEYCLSTHKIYHRTIGYFGCIYCNRKFNTMTAYRKHKNHHFSQLNVDNPTKCEHCDETFVAFREMITHMREVHGDDKEWVVLPKESIEEECPICKKVVFNLHRHLDYHEENRCKKCGEYFFSRTDFDNHLCSIESDDETAERCDGSLESKYQECSFCFKPITRISSELKHLKIHRGSGSISCRFCPHKFKTMDAFNIHAFSHRSRKYNKKPIKCRKCNEHFVKYGPFMKHMKTVHKSTQKMHYRAIVKAEPCVVCGDEFPNLHNHYRAHLQNQCQSCKKYFTSSKLFSRHQCDVEDADPSKVFTCDANLLVLINTYVPKDEKDDEKYYGHDDGQEDQDDEAEKAENDSGYINLSDIKTTVESQDEESQEAPVAEPDPDERSLHLMAQSPIISDVLSLYQNQQAHDEDVVHLTDDDSMDIDISIPVITID